MRAFLFTDCVHGLKQVKEYGTIIIIVIKNEILEKRLSSVHGLGGIQRRFFLAA